MDALLISVISACTALVASIAGPLVTLTVSRRQFNASVLSANRQKWIDSLRDMLAEPLEPDHQRLYEAIDAAMKRLESNDAADAETEADIETITALAQAILKREWQRVKAGT